MNQNKKVFYFINILSILRVVGIALIFFLDPIPLFIYVNILFITDFFDGYLARKYNVESKIGGFLDLLGDKFLVIALLGMFAYRQEVSILIFGLITLREVISMILRISSLLGKEQKIISPSMVGKSKTALQFIAIDALILSIPYNAILFWIVIIMAYYSLATYFIRAKEKNE